MVERLRACGVAYSQKAGGNRINQRGIELVEVSSTIYEDSSLEGLFSKWIIPDTVMGKIVKDFESQKVARRWHIGVPIENRTVDNLYMVGMPTRRGGASQLGGLEGGKGRGNFDNFKLCSRINIWMEITDIVQDVEHQRTISSTHFVDYKIMVRMVGEFVVRNKVSGDGLAVIWAKELSRCMPELAGIVR